MIGLIGGTGFADFPALTDVRTETVRTPYGDVNTTHGVLEGTDVVFVCRHGDPPTLPPHSINYRAIVDALASLGVTRIYAVNAVGGIDPALGLADLVIPDQIIDYTWGRSHTFYDDSIHHIEFTFPFSESLRQHVIGNADCLEPGVLHAAGVYGCTQGPRLETAAEIRRLAQDGCTVVGMTAMPEAALARERDLEYAGLSVIVNKAAGLDGEAIDIDGIGAALKLGIERARTLIQHCVATH